MKERLVLFVVRKLVPYLLDKLIYSDKVPSVTTGMVKDYEIKVGVDEPVRVRNALKREQKYQ